MKALGSILLMLSFLSLAVLEAATAADVTTQAAATRAAATTQGDAGILRGGPKSDLEISVTADVIKSSQGSPVDWDIRIKFINHTDKSIFLNAINFYYPRPYVYDKDGKEVPGTLPPMPPRKPFAPVELKAGSFKEIRYKLSTFVYFSEPDGVSVPSAFSMSKVYKLQFVYDPSDQIAGDTKAVSPMITLSTEGAH